MGNRHKFYLINHIQYSITDSQDKEVVLEALIKIAMEVRHRPTTIQPIANICVNLIDFYKIGSEKVMCGLGLTDSKDIMELERIFKSVRESTNDYEWLTYQMKDWLKVQSRFRSMTISDY